MVNFTDEGGLPDVVQAITETPHSRSLKLLS